MSRDQWIVVLLDLLDIKKRLEGVLGTTAIVKVEPPEGKEVAATVSVRLKHTDARRSVSCERDGVDLFLRSKEKDKISYAVSLACASAEAVKGES